MSQQMVSSLHRTQTPPFGTPDAPGKECKKGTGRNFCRGNSESKMGPTWAILGHKKFSLLCVCVFFSALMELAPHRGLPVSSRLQTPNSPGWGETFFVDSFRVLRVLGPMGSGEPCVESGWLQFKSLFGGIRRDKGRNLRLLESSISL